MDSWQASAGRAAMAFFWGVRLAIRIPVSLPLFEAKQEQEGKADAASKSIAGSHWWPTSAKSALVLTAT